MNIDTKIVIDGPDKLGKSSYFKNKNINAYHITNDFHHTIECFNSIINHYKKLDRGPISELVYSQVFNRESRLSRSDVKEIVKNIDIYKVYIPSTTSRNIHLNLLKSSNEDKVIIENYNLINELFEKYAVEFECEIIYIDVNKFDILNNIIKNDSYNQCRFSKYNGDAGIDIKLKNDIIIEPFSGCKIETGIQLNLPDDTFGSITKRSSITSQLPGLIMDTTIIDCGYDGKITLYVYNASNEKIELNSDVFYFQLYVVRSLNTHTNLDRSTNAHGSQ